MSLTSEVLSINYPIAPVQTLCRLVWILIGVSITFFRFTLVSNEWQEMPQTRHDGEAALQDGGREKTETKVTSVSMEQGKTSVREYYINRPGSFRCI